MNNGRIKHDFIVGRFDASELLVSVNGMFEVVLGTIDQTDGTYYEVRQATERDLADPETRLLEVYTDNGSALGEADRVYSYLVIDL